MGCLGEEHSWRQSRFPICWTILLRFTGDLESRVFSAAAVVRQDQLGLFAIFLISLNLCSPKGASPTSILKLAFISCQNPY